MRRPRTVCRRWLRLLAVLVAVQVPAHQALAQSPLPGTKVGGTPNVKVVSHIPIRGFMQTVDIEIEQEMSRPFVYLSRSRLLTNEAGFTVVSIEDPENAEMIYSWRLENAELSDQGLGRSRGQVLQGERPVLPGERIPVRSERAQLRPRRRCL